jgi:hypothetical protein
VLPDDDHVLYTIEYNGKPFEEADVAVVSLSTGATKTLVKGGAYARYSPSGHLVYARGDRLLAVPFDTARVEVTGEAITVATGVSAEIGRGRSHFAVSRAGSLVYAPGDVDTYARELLWVGRDGSTAPATKARRGFHTVGLDAAGGRVLLGVAASDDDIWMLDLVRDVPTRLTFGTENGFPAFAPDDNRFAWSSDRHGAFNVYLSSIGHPEQIDRLTQSGSDQVVSGFSADGKAVIYVQADPVTQGDIWRVPVDGDHRPQPLVRTPFEEAAPAASPDGRWLAFASDETGRQEVYVQAFSGPGPKQQVSPAGGTRLKLAFPGRDRPLRWSWDSRTLFYWNGDRLMSVSIAPGAALRSGPPTLVFELANVIDAQPAPDGQRFLAIREVAPIRLSKIVVAFGGALAIGQRR